MMISLFFDYSMMLMIFRLMTLMPYADDDAIFFLDAALRRPRYADDASRHADDDIHYDADVLRQMFSTLIHAMRT